MKKVSDVYNVINSVAPFNLQESWDNSGLILGDMSKEINKILIALDITCDIVDEAVRTGCELIVTHHPVIFNAVKRIDYKSVIARLIRNDIAVISAHTNLDIADGGVNDVLCKKLGIKDANQPLEVTSSKPYYELDVYVPVTHLEDVYNAMKDAKAGTLGNYSGCAFYVEGTGTFMPLEGSNAFIGEIGKREEVKEARIEMIVPESRKNNVVTAMIKAHPYETPAYSLCKNYGIIEDFGIGRIGNLNNPCTADELAQLIKEKLSCGVVRYNDCGNKIKQVGVCSGSGGSLALKAKALGCDAIITGDVKHDVFVDATSTGITVFDAGHFATENIILQILKNNIENKMDEISVSIAKSNKDILKYI